MADYSVDYSRFDNIVDSDEDEPAAAAAREDVALPAAFNPPDENETDSDDDSDYDAVSYTHLTLPTILLV